MIICKINVYITERNYIMSTKYFNFNNEQELFPINYDDETGKVSVSMGDETAEFDDIQDFAENYAVARNVLPENLKNWTLIDDPETDSFSFVLKAGTAGMSNNKDIINYINELVRLDIDPQKIPDLVNDKFGDKAEEPENVDENTPSELEARVNTDDLADRLTALKQDVDKQTGHLNALARAQKTLSHALNFPTHDEDEIQDILQQANDDNYFGCDLSDSVLTLDMMYYALLLKSDDEQPKETYIDSFDLDTHTTDQIVEDKFAEIIDLLAHQIVASRLISLNSFTKDDYEQAVYDMDLEYDVEDLTDIDQILDHVDADELYALLLKNKLRNEYVALLNALKGIVDDQHNADARMLFDLAFNYPSYTRDDIEAMSQDALDKLSTRTFVSRLSGRAKTPVVEWTIANSQALQHFDDPIIKQTVKYIDLNDDDIDLDDTIVYKTCDRFYIIKGYNDSIYNVLTNMFDE